MTDEQITELAGTISLPEFGQLAARVLEKHFGPGEYGAVTWAVSSDGPQAVLPIQPITMSGGVSPKRMREHVPNSLLPCESAESQSQVARASR